MDQQAIKSKLIRIILFSYKNKNLQDIVDAAIAGASANLCIDIIDKNQINRQSIFEGYDSASYRHKHWSEIDSPTKYKADLLEGSQFDYFMIMSDDVVLNPGWDKTLIEFVENNNCIVSGFMTPKIYHKDKFYLGKTMTKNDDFAITNYIDRNLVFGTNKTMTLMKYPTAVKYNGEEEILSLSLFCDGIDIYSAPSWLCKDLNTRTIDNGFVQFSVNHNYNNFVEALRSGIYDNIRTTKEFMVYHNIDINSIFPLPFQRNDVSYNPELDIHTDKGERFFKGKASL